MSEGQHRARVVVAADGKSAERGMSVLKRENRQLHQEVDKLSAALGKAEARNERLVASTDKLGRAQQEAAAAAERRRRAETAAAATTAAIDRARRSREQLEASGRATTQQRIAAINAELSARLQQVAVEKRAATTVADAYKLENRAQQIVHEAHMARLRVQREEVARTAEAQVQAAKRAQRAEAEAQQARERAWAANERSQGALAAQRRAMGGGGMGTLGAIGGVAGIAAGSVAVLGAAATEVADLADESMRLQGVFQNLPYSLNAARAATRGFADDATLATMAVKAQQTGVAATALDFADLAGKAQLLAQKTGRDVPDTITRLVEGIGKQERELFDELGLIIPHQDQINRRLAEGLGITTAELTTQQRAAGFHEEVMLALTKATDGLEGKMEGAAASIARTTVRVKNLRTAALGGVEAQASLAEGVRQLDVTVLRNLDTVTTYRHDFYALAAALDDAGVNTEKYANDARGLERDVRELLKTDAKRLEKLALQGKLTEKHVEQIDRLRAVEGTLSRVQEEILYRDLKRLDLENEQTRAADRAAQAAKAAKEEELRDIENQLAFGRAAQSSQEQINLLVQEEAWLKAELLDLEGETAKAIEVRREAELAAFEAAGAITKPRRGGGRGKSRKDAARELAVAEADARISAAQRAAAAIERSVDRQEASYQELRAAILDVQEAERARAELDVTNAKGKADRLRAETALADLQAQQATELADLAEAEAAAERERTAALWESVRAKRAAAAAGLEHQQAIKAAYGVRAGPPSRRTAAQVFGLDPGPMSREDAQAKAEMDAEHARAAEVRALRATHLAEERAYYQLQLGDRESRDAALSELRRIEQEEKQLAHEADLQRIEALTFAEEEALRRAEEMAEIRKTIAKTATDFAISNSEQALRAAMSIAKTERAAARQAMAAARKEGKSKAEVERAGVEAAKHARGESLMALGDELIGKGIAYQFESIAAFAAQNYVMGGLLQAASAITFAGAAAVKARARTLTGGGGGGGEGEAAASAAGTTGTPSNPLGAGGQGSLPDFPGSAPPGQQPPTPGNPAGGQSAGSSSSSSSSSSRTVNVEINAPLIDERTVYQIRDVIESLNERG